MAVILLALSIAEKALGKNESMETPPTCAAWHRALGESRAINLERLREGYEAVKGGISRAFAEGLREDTKQAGLGGYTSGLRACGRGGKRTFRPEGKVPPEFLGKTLWFTHLKGKGPRSPPRVIQEDPGTVIFLAGIDRLEDLSEVSKTFGRPVSLAPRGLPQALGLRCVPAIVVISKNGEVDIHEDP